MRSICFFASYFTQKELPYYISVYISELKKHFTEVVLLTSQFELTKESLNTLEDNGIKVCFESNEGYDFGMWYKAFQKYDPDSYDQVALVNDSCILFKSLDEVMNWSLSNAADFQGITSSEAISPHLQSYFLIINKNAIKHTIHYFTEHKLVPLISKVITTYEVGLSTYLVSKGLKLAAFIDNQEYRGEFSPYYHCIDYHISKGIPLIKKKILFSSYRKDELFTLARMNFDLNPSHYVRLIKKCNALLILDFEKLKSDQINSIETIVKIRYWLMRNVINLARPINSIRKKIIAKV